MPILGLCHISMYCYSIFIWNKITIALLVYLLFYNWFYVPNVCNHILYDFTVVKKHHLDISTFLRLLTFLSDNKNMELAVKTVHQRANRPQPLRHVRTIPPNRGPPCVRLLGPVRTSMGLLWTEEEECSSWTHWPSGAFEESAGDRLIRTGIINIF